MESDWPRRNKSHYVTEIVSWLGFADIIFGGDKRQPEIRLHSQASILPTDTGISWFVCAKGICGREMINTLDRHLGLHSVDT